MIALLLACGSPDTDSTTNDPSETAQPPDSGEAPLWTGTAEVVVTDPDGTPVPDASVMLGGWSEERWVLTDAEGRAEVAIDDDGISDRVLHAGKEGWISSGVSVPDTAPDPFAIELRPLPDDNPDYAFQPAGSSTSPTSGDCGHCHLTIADDWTGSRHATAASNPRVWDLYAGRASAGDCDSLGGTTAEGQVPGEDGVDDFCYVGEGVLPWLNDCTDGCDHPDNRAALTSFGSCGDCHAPATDGGTPGSIDLAAASGVAFEGVTCDLCHKIREVTPGGAPGLDGAIALGRPAEEPRIGGQEFDPITFGPYPDVIVPIMNGSYAPQFREAEWCSACHEYDQPALHPDQALDAARWPDGLPVLETFSELEASGAGMGCRDCHMTAVDEESSTYDITPDGLSPSVAHGWVRDHGEVRHHGTPNAEELGDPVVTVTLEGDGDDVVASVRLSHAAAHAVPTGEPLRQLIVLVTAYDEHGNELVPTGGQAVPDVGGHLAEVVLDGPLTDGALDPWLADADTVRFVRPTGTWDDYSGPGTGHFDGLDAEAKGLPVYEPLGELPVADDKLALTDAPDLQAGDIAYVVGAEHHAGRAGWLYAKVLVNADGTRGVAHYRAVDVASDNRLGAFGSATSEHRFPAEAATVSATLVRRWTGATVADTYGWAYDDREATTVSETWTPPARP